MGPLLTERWLGGGDRLAIVDDAAVAVAREAVRSAGAAAGLDADQCERLAATVSELARNQLRHATGGAIAVCQVRRGGVAGIEIVAADRGAGIADPTAALAGVPRTAGSLGVGLSAVLRLADEVDADIRGGEGTCFRARVFAAAVARSEIAILGRPGPGDPVSGDDAEAIRDGDRVLVGVVDGLGHGPLARDAAQRAVGELSGGLRLALPDLLARCDEALSGSRGAVVSVARIDLTGGRLEHAGVGNVISRLHGSDGGGRALLTTAGTLGVGRLPRRIPCETAPFAPPQVLVVVSDGIVSRLDLSDEPALLRRHPLVVAHHVMTRFGRGTDDALVLVVR